MTIDRPEDAARHDIGDALAGGEVGISRDYADQLAADPPGTDKAPVPPRADAPPDAGGRRRRRQRRRSFGTGRPSPQAGAHHSAGTAVAAQPPHRR